MKGDFSRRTFDPRKHYSGVQMQQGRVQVDADWNEQGDILAHRIGTETEDVIGACGAPLHEAGFHVVADANDLTAEEKALAGNSTPPPLPTLLAGGSDFFISAGRYYVDGILCENERVTTYRGQKDLPDPGLMAQNGLHLVYLDVWQRHLTALDDPSIREVALGGPDTATRIKTVWQVKWWRDANADANCLRSFDRFKATLPARDGKLTARTQTPGTNPDPCVIPPSAGYRGLENQLYRVEVHHPGAAYDVAGGANVFTVIALPQGAPNQVTVGAGTWSAGEIVEVFRTAAGSDPMAGILAQVVAVGGAGNRTLSLNRDLPGLTLADLPKVRRVTATFKWSRDNGSVVTAIERIDGNQITAHDLGPDAVLGFAPGQWVEITDDGFELNAKPAQLAQIAAVNPSTRVITLKAPATSLGTVNGVNPDRHPKLRRWDGIGAIRRNPPVGAEDFQNLEDGIQVQFSAGNYVTGDYWQIPARTATAEADSGTIEWPRDAGGNFLPRPPAGILHHYCPLGLLNRTGATLTTGADCRALFPPLTELATLVYVGGDGQEAMPGDPIPELLQVGVFRGRWPVANRRVRFTADGNGRLAANLAGLPASTSNTFEDVTGPDGIASCAWRLAADRSNSATWTPTSQQVEARLLDANGAALDPVVWFNGNLSIAEQVAYDPPCPNLAPDNTVKLALDRIVSLSRIFYVSGDGQDATLPTLTLPLPLRVAVANDCGPVIGARVRFEAEGAGRVAASLAGLPASTTNNLEDTTTAPDGVVQCAWRLDPNGNTSQQLTATLVDAGGKPLHSPRFVLFTGNRAIAANVSYTPSDACPGLNDAVTVQAALDTLCERENTYLLLRYVSGDGQEGLPNTKLKARLVVAVENVLGEPQRDMAVNFTVVDQAGGAETTGTITVISPNGKTEPDGMIRAEWVLGPAAGLNLVKASLNTPQAGTPEIIFNARGVAPIREGGGLCTITVGDGTISHGQFDGYEGLLKARDKVLQAGGGTICILRGDYELKDTIIVRGCDNIAIHGNRFETVIRKKGPSAFRFIGCGNVELRDLRVDQEDSVPDLEQHRQLDGAVTFTQCVRVILEDCTIVAWGNHPKDSKLATACLFIEDGDNTKVKAGETRGTLVRNSRCIVSGTGRMGGVWARRTSGGEVRGCTINVYAEAGLTGIDLDSNSDRWLIEENEIAGIQPDMAAHTVGSRGGVRIGSGCDDVLVQGNRITNGAGFGVGLGSVTGLLSGGGLRGLTIHRNVIRCMALSGIGVLGFVVKPTAKQQPVTNDLLISANRIESCAFGSADRIVDETAGGQPQAYRLSGGVALWMGDGIRLLDNEVHDNGYLVDPQGAPVAPHPVSGVVIVHPGVGLVLSRNHLLGNFSPGKGDPKELTFPGGIILPTSSAAPPLVQSVLMVTDNEVVTPGGPALVWRGRGAPILVANNHLSAQHNDAVLSLSDDDGSVQCNGNQVISLLQGDKVSSAVRISARHTTFNANHCVCQERLPAVSHVVIEGRSADATGNHCLEKEVRDKQLSLLIKGDKGAIIAVANVTTNGVKLDPDDPAARLANVKGVTV